MAHKRGVPITDDIDKQDILDDYTRRINVSNEKLFSNKIQLNNYGYNGVRSITKSVSGKFYDKFNVKIEEKSDISGPLQGQSRLIALDKMHQFSPAEIFQEDTGVLIIDQDIQSIRKSNVLNHNTQKLNEYISNRIVNQLDSIAELNSQAQLVQEANVEKIEEQNSSFHGGQPGEENFELNLSQKKSVNVSHDLNENQNNLHNDESKFLSEKSFTKQQTNNNKKIENSNSDHIEESTLFLIFYF